MTEAAPAPSSSAETKAEIEGLRRSLTAALEQQTTTSEILRVISSSPADVRPVFDAIVRGAQRLLGAHSAAAFQLIGDLVHRVAATVGGPGPATLYPLPLGEMMAANPVAGRVWTQAELWHVTDTEADAYLTPVGRSLARSSGYRSLLWIPMVRDRDVVGVIAVTRPAPGGFADAEIALLRTFADQAVIAIENVRLFTELQEKNRALTDAHARVTEALDQQTATSEILGVISRSPTEVGPVFDAVVASAARLCEANDVALLLVDGADLRLAAGVGPLYMSIPSDFKIRLTRGSAATRAVIDRATVHIHDFAAQPEEEFPVGRELARRFGHRTMLAVPLLRERAPIGVICAFRLEVRPFLEQQVALLQTFADQAVIAIENVRLFTEVQEKNRELTQAHGQVIEALERQTATSEILRTIALAQTDVQPVFDTIVRSAAQLCRAENAAVFVRGGRMLYHPASYGTSPGALAAVRAGWPRPVGMDTTAGIAVLTRSVVHVPDIEDPSALEIVRQTGRALEFRSVVTVPMLREREAVGAILVARREPGRFADADVELLKTFADQAVIAIENVRLFTELQARNRDLTEALEQQTATAEILRVISQAQTDVQPVFDAIVRNAVRLCGASHGGVYRFDGELVHSAAHAGYTPDQLEHWRRQWPRPVTAASVACQAIRTGGLVRIADVETAAEMHALTPETLVNLRARGARSVMAVPMFRQHEVVGAISLGHRDVGAFSDADVELLKTFADQAVIAVENVRLLTELQTRTRELTRSVEELTALGDVGRTLSSTLDLETVLQTIVARANMLAGTAGCTIWEYDDAHGQFHLRVSHYADERDAAILGAPHRVTTIRRGQGVTTQVVERRQPVQIADIALAGAYESPIRGALLEAGHRGLLGVPLLREEQVIGVLAVTRKTPGEFEPDVVRLLSTFATQSALAIQNARLFREIEDKSRQLEIASQHKSEFLANMSHELRTPLNAVIGFSEVLSERMFGELNEKQEEYLKDIHASGQHLLSLINDILDLSKVEAGRMELELTDFNLPATLDNALTLVRERAGRHGIALHVSTDERVEQVRADERKIRQVVLNLLSNAIKFTPEGGRIDVRALPTDGAVEVSVSDTGVGIALEDQEAIFEEFRQVGTVAKKVEGTGLGLALSRKFIELHGGRIWVESQAGVGSTFTFTIPVRRGE